MAGGRRLRIAFLVDVFDGIKTGGVLSAQRFVAALRQHHEVTVVTTGEPAEGRVILPAFSPPPFHRVMRDMGFTFARPRDRVLERVIRRADVVHVQFPFWLGVRGVGLARSLGKPVVAGFHLQPENLFYNVGLRSRALNEWTYRLFLRQVYGRAQRVVCPSRFAEKALAARGLETPTVVISNGIPGGPAVAAPRARDDRTFVVVAVGRLAREKRLDVVIEGVRRSRFAERIELVITGRGPIEAEVRRRATTLPRPATVTFATDDELAALLARADLLVHGSEVELEGMAILEALGQGTPALIADAPASAAPELALMPELLFRAGDPADLARHLDALLTSPALLARARDQARIVAPRYTLAESVRRLEAVYLSLAPDALEQGLQNSRRQSMPSVVV
jgi:glycosyltransferase involved in cell wall biosynthesis